MSQKKGLMVEFLVTLVLAIIIFVPACYFVSNALRLSDQGQSSYVEFAKSLKDFSKSNELKKSVVLKLDQGTGILLYADKERLFAFETKTDYVESSGENKFHKNILITQNYLPFPESHCSVIPCTCLCRGFKDIGSTEFESSNPDFRTTIIRKDLSCELLQCQNLEEVKVKESWSLYRGKNEQRRAALNLIKEDSFIKIINTYG